MRRLPRPSPCRLGAALLAAWLALSPSGPVLVGIAPAAGALSAGRTLAVQTQGDLALLAATSTRQESIQSTQRTRKTLETLNYELDQTRVLLSTITAGNSVDLQVGGSLAAQTATRDAQGNLQADRMTAQGVVKGADRQQVSVTGSGAGNSKVLGNLASQGIRSGANDAFTALATKEGQAAVASLLQGGLVSIRNTPEIQTILATPSASAMTYKDDSGKVQLTLAGQARVQEIYSTLRLNETFTVTKMADQGLAQAVTLVAAIALTVAAPGAGATLIGATSGTVSAAVANAAFAAMTSTMVGQMAAGASFGEAFEAGLKAGTSAAITAGILNAPVIETANGMQSINQVAGLKDVAGTGAKIASGDWSNLGQNLGGMALRGTVNAAVNTAIYGGSFGDAFAQSFVSDLGSVATNAVGQAFAYQRGAGGVGFEEGGLLHSLAQAGVGGATQALLSKGDKGTAFLSGAVGAGVSAAAGDLLAKAGGGDAVQSGLAALVGAGAAAALGLHGFAAANAAMNETLNNRRSPKVEAIVQGARSCTGDACLRSLDVIRQEQQRVAAEIRACEMSGSCSASQQLTLHQDQNGLAIQKEQTIRRGIDQGVISGFNPPSDYFAGLGGIGMVGTGLAATRLGGTAGPGSKTGAATTIGTNGSSNIENAVLRSARTGSATKVDVQHSFPDVIDNYAGEATKFSIPTKGPGGGVVRHSDFYQVEGSMNGKQGVFEWIVDQNQVTHRRFIPNGTITGSPNQIPPKP